eukprot:1151643-Pelagomonas_calceolata.AAC.6
MYLSFAAVLALTEHVCIQACNETRSTWDASVSRLIMGHYSSCHCLIFRIYWKMIAQQLKVNTYLAPCQGVLLAIHASSPPSLPVPEVKTEEAMAHRAYKRIHYKNALQTLVKQPVNLLAIGYRYVNANAGKRHHLLQGICIRLRRHPKIHETYCTHRLDHDMQHHWEEHDDAHDSLAPPLGMVPEVHSCRRVPQ